LLPSVTVAHTHLPSSPTRRSSDLVPAPHVGAHVKGSPSGREPLHGPGDAGAEAEKLEVHKRRRHVTPKQQHPLEERGGCAVHSLVRSLEGRDTGGHARPAFAESHLLALSALSAWSITLATRRSNTFASASFSVTPYAITPGSLP